MINRYAVNAQRIDGPNATSELRFDYPEDGVTLGDGWDTGREVATKNACLQFTPSTNSKPYQTVSYEVRSFEDHSSLMNALDISASFQMSSVIGAKAGIKASYATKTENTFDRIYFVARALVVNRSEFVTPDLSGRLMLKPWALELAQNDTANFLRTCGDGYVSSIVSGAELYSVIEITETSQRSREQLKIELTGSGAGMDFTAALQKVSDRYSSGKTFNMTYQKTGGSGDPIPSTGVNPKSETGS